MPLLLLLSVPGQTALTAGAYPCFCSFTAPFSNIQTLKFKVQLTNTFFTTVNQIFGGSSQCPTTAERMVMKSFSTVQTTKQCMAVVRS